MKFNISPLVTEVMPSPMEIFKRQKLAGLITVESTHL